MSMNDYCEMILSTDELANVDKWLEYRKLGIGGSDAAAILGLNPWKSAYQLWLEKTGEIEVPDISDKEPVHFGTILEQVVADEFCRREGKRVKRCGMYKSRKHPFMTASFDRLVVGERAGLECKTANFSKAKEWDEGEIPPAYYAQCQHYMMVSGLPKWYLSCLIGGNHFVTWVIERDEEDIAALERAECDFWIKVQEHIMPDVDGSDSCTEALRKKFNGGGLDPVILPQESVKLLERFDELKAMEADVKNQKQEIQNQLCLMLGDNEVGYVGEGEDARKVTWKTVSGRTTIDTKKLKLELPDIYEKYSKKGADSRRFSA